MLFRPLSVQTSYCNKKGLSKVQRPGKRGRKGKEEKKREKKTNKKKLNEMK